MPATEAASLASKQPTVGRRANTAGGTAAKIAETPHGMRIYTDGGVNRDAKTKVWGVAGYGAAVLRLMEATAADGDEAAFDTVADIFGPVVTEKPSHWFLECERGTNNTGEICGIIQALLWLLYFDMEDDKVDVIILYDSMYAADVIQGTKKAKANTEVVQLAQAQLTQVRAQRQVTFIHVKGHSA